MLAGVGVGIFKDYRDAVFKTTPKVNTFTPNKKNHNKYQKYYHTIFNKLYKQNKEISKLINTEF